MTVAHTPRYKVVEGTYVFDGCAHEEWSQCEKYTPVIDNRTWRCQLKSGHRGRHRWPADRTFSPQPDRKDAE